MKLRDLLSGYSVTEEEITANVRQEGSLFDRASAEALIQQARQDWPVQFDGEEGAPEELTPLEACVSCYLRGMYVAKSQIDILVDRVAELEEKKEQLQEQIRKSDYAAQRAQMIQQCFLDFLDEAVFVRGEKDENKRLISANHFFEKLSYHQEEVYIVSDLLTDVIAELNELRHLLAGGKPGSVKGVAE